MKMEKKTINADELKSIKLKKTIIQEKEESEQDKLIKELKEKLISRIKLKYNILYMPRVKRCPKHSRRKPRKTGRCVNYNPPYQKKYERCKDGTRDDGSGRPFPENCVNYTPSNRPKRWTRCKKGTRKNKITKKCEPYKNMKDISYNSKTASELNEEDKDILIKKLNEERKKLKALLQKTNESKTFKKHLLVKEL